MLVTDKVCRLPTLRICPPLSARADPLIWRQARLNVERIRVSLTTPFGVHIVVDYGKTCGACHGPWDVDESVYSECDDSGGEDSGRGGRRRMHQEGICWDNEWMSLDNPDERSTSSEEPQGSESGSDSEDAYQHSHDSLLHDDGGSSYDDEAEESDEEDEEDGEGSLVDGDFSDGDCHGRSQEEGDSDSSGDDSDNNCISDDDLLGSKANSDHSSGEEEFDSESGCDDGYESDDDSDN
ncbi:hypothetical protein C8Q73DRAFT_688118 [Cubamyces lactineus]|nr:hypothetical protein C8Q73DRAFT_688118 [Cubamyces lactineus]